MTSSQPKFDPLEQAFRASRDPKVRETWTPQQRQQVTRLLRFNEGKLLGHAREQAAVHRKPMPPVHLRKMNFRS